MMRVRLALLLGLVAAVGCSRAKQDTNPPPHYTAKVILDAHAPPGTYLPVDRAMGNTLRAAAADSPTPDTKRLNVLAVSGGGQFGAYGAGVLIGWTCRGDRPQFDVVTGISSGALIATLVYAGPKYDPLLQHLFTSLRTEQVFRYRPLLVHLIRDKALATADPLKQLIEQTVNAELLADIRSAHQSGRRLFVGTMNVLTREPVFWDLGAIACSGRPDADEMVRRLLLATSSISGMVPPVPIDVEVNGVCYREYHGDGGGVAQTFVRFGPETPRPDPAHPSAKWLAGSNLYVISGGKLYKEILDRPPGVAGAILSNVSANLYALFRSDVWKLFTLCAVSGMNFNLTAIPPDVYNGEESTSFDPELQQRLFTIGYDRITRREAWRHTPPGYEPGEENLPRAGFRFTVPPEGTATQLAMPRPVAVPVPPEAPPERPAVRVRHRFDLPRL